jgi:hypothetical protein
MSISFDEQLNFLNKTDQLQTIFNHHFDLNDTLRSAVVFNYEETDSPNCFDVLNENLIIDKGVNFSVKNLRNGVLNQKSTAHRAFIGNYSLNQMLKSDTTAKLFLSLYLNQALIELTNKLGSEVVQNKDNELKIKFVANPDVKAVEMHTILIVSK